MTASEAIVKLRHELSSIWSITNHKPLIIDEYSGVLSEEHSLFYTGLIIRIDLHGTETFEKHILVAYLKGFKFQDSEIKLLLNKVGKHNDIHSLHKIEYDEI